MVLDRFVKLYRNFKKNIFNRLEFEQALREKQPQIDVISLFEFFLNESYSDDIYLASTNILVRYKILTAEEIYSKYENLFKNSKQIEKLLTISVENEEFSFISTFLVGHPAYINSVAIRLKQNKKQNLLIPLLFSNESEVINFAKTIMKDEE